MSKRLFLPAAAVELFAGSFPYLARAVGGTASELVTILLYAVPGALAVAVAIARRLLVYPEVKVLSEGADSSRSGIDNRAQ